MRNRTMIDQETRAALISEGWVPPKVLIDDYEPWRAAIIAFWQDQNVTAATLIAGDPFDESDKRAARRLAALQLLMPPIGE